MVGNILESVFRSHLFRDSCGVFLLKITSTLLTLISTLILARLLGVSGYGAYANAEAWVIMLTPFSTLGLHQLLIREVAIHHNENEWKGISSLVSFSDRAVIFASLILIVVAAILGKIIIGSADKTTMLLTLWVALLALPFYSLILLRQSTLAGLQRIILSQVPEMLIRPGILVFMLVCIKVCASQPLSAPAIFVLNLCAAIFAFIMGTYYLRTAWPVGGRGVKSNYRIKQWMHSALPLMLIGAMQLTNRKFDTIMLGAMGTAEAVGIYGAASRVSWVMAFTLAALNTALAPSISALYYNKRLHRLEKLLTNASLLTFSVALFTWFVFIIYGKSIMSLFGDSFECGYSALVILSTGILFCTIGASVGLLLMMTGFEKDAARATGIAVVVNIILNFLLIPKYSYDGAACATALSTVMLNFLLIFLVYKRIHINPTVFRSWRR